MNINNQSTNNSNIVNYIWLKILIIFIIIINSFGLFFPILMNDDAVLYANIAKHILVSNNWSDLIYLNEDWLDKPHLPFWITALFFKLFGINSASYILPGFLFNLLGSYYTYRLAKHIYNTEIGLIASLLTLSSLHLLLSSVDVRAEAFLLGEIMPACYFWYLYNEKSNINLKYLLLGAFFTALALMTKGIFTLLTIMSGIITIWIYKKQFFKNIICFKYLITILLSLLFIFPEIISLYLQFDLHPEKLVFGQLNMSGIKWYFWDSQVGRFFNDSFISRSNVSQWHYLFFVHTFLWAFLPWTAIFILALWHIKQQQNLQDKLNTIYLLGSFMPTFVLFSASSFQLDHYINILIPFAAIICAKFLYQKLNSSNKLPLKQIKFLTYTQIVISIILTIIILVFNYLLFTTNIKIQVAITISCIIILGIFIFSKSINYLMKIIFYPLLSISLVFVFIMLVYGKIYIQYDAGYQMAKIINNKNPLPVFDYGLNAYTLNFYLKSAPYHQVKDISQILDYATSPNNQPFYLAIRSDQLNTVTNKINHIITYNNNVHNNNVDANNIIDITNNKKPNYHQMKVLAKFNGGKIHEVLNALLYNKQIPVKNKLTSYILIEIY